ncbi:RNA-guided endonuclease InsQ/TnpB family protein, partial [Rhodococcus zopfii]
MVRYNYRLRPGALAERALIAEWHRCRFLWNEAVHLQKTGGRPNFATLGKLLTEARARSSWLRDGSQVAQQQMLRTYAQALDASFTVTGRGRPRYKARKKTLPSLEYTRRGFRIRGGQLALPEGVSNPVVWSRELPSEPSSVRIACDSLGHGYASFVVTREKEPVAAVDEGKGVGIDWGVTQTATATAEEFDLPHAQHRKRCAAELAKSQKRMARRRRGKGVAPSRGYRQARRQAATVQKKAARQNRHDGKMWARSVVAEHQLIAVEDFTPRFLAKSTMARKAADAAVGTIKRELIEQGRRAGRKVVVVRPAYTTMTCSGCFARAKQRLGLGERIFRCWACGHAACRDRNAARVVLVVA